MTKKLIDDLGSDDRTGIKVKGESCLNHHSSPTPDSLEPEENQKILAGKKGFVLG